MNNEIKMSENWDDFKATVRCVNDERTAASFKQALFALVLSNADPRKHVA